jgi:hypothetical protein
MHADNNENRRNTERLNIDFKNVTGVFEISSDHNWQPLMISNISNDGMCILSNNQIVTGENVSIMISKPFKVQINCLVAWCKKLGDGYIVGLYSLEKSNRLQSLHTYLLKDNNLGEISKAG